MMTTSAGAEQHVGAAFFSPVFSGFPFPCQTRRFFRDKFIPQGQENDKKAFVFLVKMQSNSHGL